MAFGLLQKMCDQQEFVILTHFVHHDNLQKWTQRELIFKPKYSFFFLIKTFLACAYTNIHLSTKATILEMFYINEYLKAL